MAKQPTGAGKGQNEAGHTYHAKMMGASPGLPQGNLLTSLRTPPTSQSLPAIRTEAFFVLRGLESDPER